MPSPREFRPDAQTALDLLARHMWIADQIDKGRDGVEAAQIWDDDLLLMDTYEDFEAMANDAVVAEMTRRVDDDDE